MESLIDKGWEIIVRSHQVHFGVATSANQMRPTLDQFGISRILTRLDTEAQAVLNIESLPVLINPKDHRLVFLIVMNSHLHSSAVLTDAHLGSSTTQARIMSGRFPVYFPSMGKICRRIVDKCPTCAYVKSKPRQREMAVPSYVKYLQSDRLVWCYTSSDMIGLYSAA